MENIPGHKILQFHPDTLQCVRRDLGLDKPGQMDAAIDLLDDWVRKQAHFTKTDFSREYLERIIIFDKGSVERAKQQMDKLFTMKPSFSSFFDKIDAKNDFGDVHDYFVDAVLPKLTKDHFRIYAGKVIKDGSVSKTIKLAYMFGTLLFEHIRAKDYCSGFVGILDYRNINLTDLMAQINIMDLHQFLLIVTELYQLRVKGIHILTSSKGIEILVRLMKQVFSKKIGDRIRVHMTVDSLHEYLPKDVLPIEFGGTLKSIIEMNNDWVEFLGSEENIEYFKEMRKATVNENLRSKTDNTNEDILGVSGSFKTLCVD